MHSINVITKFDLEKLENKILASWACRSKNSIGRAFPEKEDDLRTIFQRDRDRVVHSRAFRRLRHKTQVFVASEGDHYRNRLSHSLEVAQVSRHIARLLRLNEDLAETIALAHDLGHTSFGHAGETVLNKLMKDFGGFEHNQQSKKIVEVLEVKYPNFIGLNLSFEVRQGLIKHESPFDKAKFLNDGKRNTLEAQVVNIADEIAYNNHDLDDGLTSKILKMTKLRKEVELIREAAQKISSEYTNLQEKELQNLCVSYLINHQIRNVVKETLRRLKKYKLKRFEDIAVFRTSLVDFNSEMKEKNVQLRRYLRKVFYYNPKVVRMNKRGEEILKKLFDYYCKNKVINNEPRLRDYYKALPKENEACDYIAGMTDSFAKEEASRYCL